MPRILLLRHGETDWNRDDRIQGWERVSLNERGREQAAAAGRYLARYYPDVDRVISSDLPRAAETADVVTDADALDDVPVRYDDAWRERDFGVYQGRDGSSFFQEHPEFAVIENCPDARTNVPEGGECYATFRERILDAWAELRREADGTVVVVTHCGPIRAIVAEVRGLDVASAHVEIHVDNGSVTEVALGDAPTLDTVNCVDHLRATT